MKNTPNRALFLTLALSMLSLNACYKADNGQETGRKLDEKTGQASQAVHEKWNTVQESVGAAMQHVDIATNDSDITAKVKMALMMRNGIDSLAISVKTHDGVVALSGSVAKASQSAVAEEVALAVDGVNTVENDLSIASALP